MFKKTVLLTLLICCSLAYGADDILIADFEGDDYGSWQVRGECFGDGPAKGTFPHQREVTGFLGKGLVNSHLYAGDELQGTLISPSFKIERKYINFLIGGGKHPSRAGVTLRIDGETARTATGKNSEKLQWATFDVTEFRGKEGVIRIMDHTSEGWGHINVDNIVQSNVPKSENIIDEKPLYRNRTLTRKMTIREKYINLPVANDNNRQRIRLLLDGRIVREFVIALAQGEADYWVVADVSEFKGKQMTIESEGMAKNDKILNQLKQADYIIGGENIYHEKLRPQFHFTSKRGWNNDTNGMVYYDGEYHMFYQHNPYGWPWGNMSWGHAVSSDMIHWKEIGDAIHPDELGTIFSGSAVVDKNNTAGFQTGSEKPIVCFYTSAGGTNPWSEGQPFTQSIAYSNDRGRTFTRYDGNPVIKHIRGGNRDPKVIWYKPSGQWVLVLYIEEGEMAFFTSDNLKNWTEQSRIKSFHECPELFELPVADKQNKKWILSGASGDYFVGNFDGKEFKPETKAIKFNYGNAFYASQTFNDIPREDGRRIQMGWGQVPMPDMPFNQMITFPVELTLRSTDQGIRMFAEPVKEVEKLHKKRHSFSNMTIDGAETLPGINGELFHIKAEFEVGAASSFGLVVREFKITYNAEEGRIICKGPESSIGRERFSEPRSAPLKPVDGKVSLDILVDRTMVEIYPNDGRFYFPMGVYLVDKDPAIKVFSKGGKTRLNYLNVYELDSIWK